MHKKKIMSLGFAVLLTPSLLVGCDNKNNIDKEEQATLKEVEVSKGTIREEISLSGSIVANKSTSITSSSKSTVKEIYVQSGEDVSEGEDIILLENGMVIEAPYDGKISKISTYVNQDVDTSTALFTIIDDSSYKVEASVDETEINKISNGQDVDITITALNKEVEGIVSNIDAQASSSGNSVSFGLVVTVDGENLDDVYSGMSTEMNIIIKESKDVLTIPIQAVSSNRGRKIVKVKDGDSTKEVEVKVGAQDSSFVEVTSGLKEGDIIVYEQSVKSNNRTPGMNGGMMDMMNGEMPKFDPSNMPSMPNMSSGGGGNRPQIPR